MLPAVLSDKSLCGFENRFGHSEAPDKKIRDRSSIFFCPLFFCPIAETMIKANKLFYFKPCGPPRQILELLRLKSVPFLAVKRPLEQTEGGGSGRNSIWENWSLSIGSIRVESHSSNYFIEDVSKVDVGANDVIAFIN